MLSLLLDTTRPPLTFGTQNPIKCLTALIAVTAHLLALDESRSPDMVGCVNSLEASLLRSVQALCDEGKMGNGITTAFHTVGNQAYDVLSLTVKCAFHT